MTHPGACVISDTPSRIDRSLTISRASARWNQPAGWKLCKFCEAPFDSVREWAGHGRHPDYCRQHRGRSFRAVVQARRGSLAGNCVECGAVTSARASYCGAKCWGAATARRNEQRRPMIKCAACPREFRAGRADRPKRFCSRKCAARAIGEARILSRAVLICENCGDSFAHDPDIRGQRFCRVGCARDRSRTVAQGPPSPKVCQQCDVRFLGTGKLCSAQCRTNRARAQAVAWARANDARDRASRPCAECGVEFAPEYGVKNRRFCSRACLKSSAPGKYIERARKFGCDYEPVSRIRVFKRDGWKCGLCGEQTLPLLNGTHHPLAPELDHIIPMSLKGPHKYDNVQCSHRACNIRKSNKVAA